MGKTFRAAAWNQKKVVEQQKSGKEKFSVRKKREKTGNRQNLNVSFQVNGLHFALNNQTPRHKKAEQK